MVNDDIIVDDDKYSYITIKVRYLTCHLDKPYDKFVIRAIESEMKRLKHSGVIQGYMMHTHTPETFPRTNEGDDEKVDKETCPHCGKDSCQCDFYIDEKRGGKICRGCDNPLDNCICEYIEPEDDLGEESD